MLLYQKVVRRIELIKQLHIKGLRIVRFCIITPEFVTEPYFSGGVAQQFYKIAKWEVENGHEVDLITFSDKNEDIIYDGIFVHRIRIPKTKLEYICNRLTRKKFRNSIRYLIFSFLAYRKAKEIHSKRHFGIVHSVNSRACGLVSLLLLRFPHVLFVSCFRPVWNKLAGEPTTLDVKAGELLDGL